ncbi:unnamed protein product, partial [Tetraodon nigroviridis]
EKRRKKKSIKFLQRRREKKETGTMGRKKIQITRIMDERNRQVKSLGGGEDG